MSTIKADNLLRSLIESGLSLTDFAILATKAMKIQRDFRSANEERRERDRIQKHLKIREKRKFERELKEEEERRIKGLAKLYEFGYVTSDDLLTTIDNNNLRTTRTNKFQIASDGDRTDVENSLIPYLKETNDLKAHQRDCCLIFNINNDLRLNQEKIERACRRAKRNIYQLRADRFNRPEYRTICSVETATLYNKFKEAVKEVNHVISDTSIHPKDKRHLNELLTYINQLEGDVGLLMCNLQYEPKVKETIIFAPVTTDILDRMNLILHYVQTLADNISTNSFMTEEKENNNNKTPTPYRLSKAALNRSTSTFLDPLHGSNHKMQATTNQTLSSSPLLSSSSKIFNSDGVYKVIVKTSNKMFAGTDAYVDVQLTGANGTSSKMPLLQSETNQDPFERDHTDTFTIDVKQDLGKIAKLTLSIVGENKSDKYECEWIEINHRTTNKTYRHVDILSSDRTYRGNIQQNLGGDSRRTELTVDLEEMPSRIGKQQSTNTISAITTVSSNYTASSQASGLTTKLDRTFDTKLPSSVVRQLSSTSVDDTVKEQVIPQRAARQAFLRTSKYDEKIHYKKFFDSLSASDNENDDFEHRNRFSAVDKRKDKKRLQKDNSEQYSISRDESETINFYETRDKSRQKNNRDIEIKEKLVSKDSPQNLVIRPTQGQSSRKSNQQQIESTNERVLTEMKKQGQSVQKVDRSENLIPTVIETNINQVSFHPLQTSKGLLTDTTNSDAVILERREIAAEAKQRQVAEKSENTSDNKLIMFPHSLLPVHNSDVGQGNKTSRSRKNISQTITNDAKTFSFFLASWFPSNTSGQLSYPKEESIIPSNTDKITQQNIARFRVSSSLTRQQKNVVSSKRRSYGSSTVSPQLVDLATQPNTNTSKVSSTSQRQNEKMSVTSTFSTPVLGLLTDEPSTTISNTSSYSSITSKVSNFTTPESTITSSKISGDTTTQSSASQANLKLNSTAAHSSKIVTSIEKQMQRPSDYTKTNKTSNQRSNVTDGKSINQKVRSTTSEYSDNDLKFVKQQQTDILTSPIAADTTSQIVTTNHPRNDQEQQSVTIKTSAANSDNDDKSMSSRQTDTSEASGLSGNMLSPDSAKKFRKRKRNRRQQQSKQSSLTEQRDELVKMADDIETFNRDQSTTKSSIISSKTNSHEQLAVHSSRIFSSDNRTKQSIQNTEEQDRRLVASRINTADSDNYMVKEQSRPQFAARSHTKDTIDRLRERESFSFSKSEKSNINDTVERAKRLAITTTNNKRPNYIIEVKTGTNGLKDKDKKHVYLQLLDNKNRTTDEIKIIPLNGDAFGKRKVNYFNVRVQPYLDQVDNIRLWYTGGNKKDIWSIDYVNVSNILTGVKKRFTTKYSLKSDSKVEFINESDYHDDDFYYLIHLASKDTDFNGKPVDAYIQLIGNKSTTDVIKIQIAPRKKKNVQFVDQIKSLQRKDIGSINSVKIWHNDKKNVKQWNLDKIDIYDNRQHEFISFNIKRHLDTKHDDKKTDITLQVSSRENLPSKRFIVYLKKMRSNHMFLIEQNSSISISNILTTTLSEDERNDINEVLPISNWLELRDRSPSNNSATRPQSATNRSHSEKTTMIQFENQKQQLISRTQRNDDEN
ncbi:unnamed protein product [Didymodactylos carnosus]|uniref:PLAT domain-containing protein n=1 Tax=Didymodactylos carnosus TaxID=1234261 RepID=A0A813YTZ4_9BILA|nr:unnamed protein product [Didymodactylos carnosus]CAF0888743.1 unnamed protein product [Didymodactylos carnosus]CAF3536867.1 unnamed protein product [Didymodactylos carnosus]CAF3673494.1 unnamed protein product [Didymodactylos carnosus]